MSKLRPGTPERRRHQRIEAAIVTLAALVVETAIALGLGFAPGLWLLWLVAHLLTSAALGFWLHMVRRRRRALRYPTLLVVAVVTLGLAGAIGAAFASLGQRVYRSEARSFQSWYFTLFPERTERKSRAWYDLARTLGDDEGAVVESFGDLIRFGDVDQKLAIIALLARRFEPRFAPVLKTALSDPDASVRVQAATAAAHIEDAFVERWISARRTAEARKNDPEAAIKLARLVDDYAFAGILDERREAELRAEAEDAYRSALEIAPANNAARLGLGRLLIRCERPEEALLEMEPLARDPSPDAAAWLMEAMFRLRRFDALRELCARLDAASLPDRLAAAVALWRPEAPLEADERAAA